MAVFNSKETQTYQYASSQQFVPLNNEQKEFLDSYFQRQEDFYAPYSWTLTPVVATAKCKNRLEKTLKFIYFIIFQYFCYQSSLLPHRDGLTF